jgi:hypothetical protein
VGQTKNLGELVEIFIDQLSYNTMIEVTLRDLEMTRQRENETFSEFLMRWRAKALKMMNRPKEKDQVNMVMKGLLPVYYNQMFASPIMDFEQLCNSGMRIEDAIDNRQLDKREGRISVAPKKTFGSSSKTPNIQANINVVQLNQYQYQCPPQHQYQNAYPDPSRQSLKPKRHFDPLGAPLSNVLEHMCKRGHLKPLDPTPYPDPFLKNWNTNLYFLFHQMTGQSTDECT